MSNPRKRIVDSICIGATSHHESNTSLLSNSMKVDDSQYFFRTATKKRGDGEMPSIVLGAYQLFG